MEAFQIQVSGALFLKFTGIPIWCFKSKTNVTFCFPCSNGYNGVFLFIHLLILIVCSCIIENQSTTQTYYLDFFVISRPSSDLFPSAVFTLICSWTLLFLHLKPIPMYWPRQPSIFIPILFQSLFTSFQIGSTLFVSLLHSHSWKPLEIFTVIGCFWLEGKHQANGYRSSLLTSIPIISRRAALGSISSGISIFPSGKPEKISSNHRSQFICTLLHPGAARWQSSCV